MKQKIDNTALLKSQDIS